MAIMKRLIISLIPIVCLSISLKAQNPWQWQNPLPQGNTLNDIIVIGQNSAIAVGQAGTVMKTTDGGNSWKIRTVDADTRNWLEICFSDAGTLWILSNNLVMKSQDMGETWLPV